MEHVDVPVPASPSSVRILHEAGYQPEETPTKPHPGHVRRFIEGLPDENGIGGAGTGRRAARRGQRRRTAKSSLRAGTFSSAGRNHAQCPVCKRHISRSLHNVSQGFDFTRSSSGARSHC